MDSTDVYTYAQFLNRRPLFLAILQLLVQRAYSLLFRSLDEDLNTLPCSDVFERVLRILKLDFISNELLDADTLRGNEVDGGLVVARPVTERALNIKFLGAHSHDRKCYVGVAHAALQNILLTIGFRCEREI